MSNKLKDVYGDLGSLVNLLRLIFVICKCIVLLFGIAGFVGSIYIIVISKDYSFLTGSPNIGNALDSGAAIGFIVSLVVIVISVVGILGAILRWRPMLLVYAITWTIIVILAVIGVIISFYYSNNVSSAAEREYRSSLTNAIKAYDTDQKAKFVIEALQEGAKCCGVNNATDWITLNPSVFASYCNQLPPSCRCIIGTDNCGQLILSFNGTNYQQTAFNRGCFIATMDYYETGLLICGAFVLTLVLIEISGILIALGLIYCITRAKKKVQIATIQEKIN